MSNYDSVRGQLISAGFILDRPLDTSGKTQRWKVEGAGRERKGWSILHTWTNDSGNECLAGSFGIWRGNDQGTQKIVPDKSEASAEEIAAIKKRLADDRKRAAQHRAAEAKRAADRAANVWHKAKGIEPDQDKPADYLVRKGIKPHGVRFSKEGAIIVPMQDGKGGTFGLQFILPSHHERKKKTGRDKEYWPAGMAKQGHWFQIGSPLAGGICLLAEGYATGATLHEATGLPVAVAFDAGNLEPVAEAIKRQYRNTRILVCADDDYLTEGNPGCSRAKATAFAVGGAWVKPEFPQDRGGKKLTDFNDLAAMADLALVRAQIEAAISQAGWTALPITVGAAQTQGGGEYTPMPSQFSVEEAVDRYWGTYGLGGKVLFDAVERRLVHRDDVMNLIPGRSWDLIKSHPRWRVARDTEIGFDPTEKDPAIRCNLFGGWPTEPKAGKCEKLLTLLEYLCSNEANGYEVYEWILKWLAYPIQHRGAKMQSTIVVHGPQGTGKSRFFEAYGKIFGPYSRVLGQEALEDKFNADWAEKKLFILADEVLARQDMYHIKNRLKGFITGDTIRVNPKGVAAHTEKNQMNIVFLSNERQPLALENDDRRHLVIWVPPKLDESFFTEVNQEIDAGGIEALHQYLLDLDLGEFKPWTKPPMTKAKGDLVELGRSSEERFLTEWMAGEIDGADGQPLPFCPCLGSSLYRAYETWCEAHGERKRSMKDLISLCCKLPGWVAGKSTPTWTSYSDRTPKNRKMVVPAKAALEANSGYVIAGLQEEKSQTKAEWLMNCFFTFEKALGGQL